MNNQTVAEMFRWAIPLDSIFISSSDADILKSLADKMGYLATLPNQKAKKELWYSHNSLKPTRPVVFCSPENGWNEIITEDQIKCEGILARQWEMYLRKEIFWAEFMGDDKVVEAVFDVSHIFTESDWGMHESVSRVQASGSYHWDPPLKNYDDINKLRFPEIHVNYKATEKVLELARSIFGDILNVRLKTVWWWTLGMTWTLINLRGLEQFMMDMYDYPKELHQLMGFLRDGYLAKLDFLEKNNLLSLNNDNTYVGSGGFGFSNELPQHDFDQNHVRTLDMWGFCESQETVSLSPEMFEEFIFPYQKTILDRFGLNCYGCCESLCKRWNVVKKFSNLRRVSVSPWANIEKMANYLGTDYIYSFKPSPADLAQPCIDKEYLRQSLKKALEITKGCCVEIVMKDNHTIGNNPQNVISWCKIAREEAEKISAK